ncbi:FkbM family methyltransferase [Paludisphaera mucosa]|uniref:FkbM family methyltransferase n=1 Tax=Paludisphaera mucosa TaxID=3030827 RepID=A0ABT6FJJ5_9BACT|nr:FkbM family methyltransferase [Paludisphaera mucosa]MDG3007758.1 FkbM family methyltransferase [Paludisphaera mucosa]
MSDSVAVSPRQAAHCSVRLPNGMAVDSLGVDDTLMVYRDIFEDDCYRRGGVAIHDGDCILDVGANTGLFILYLNSILADARVYAFEPLPATFQVLSRNIERHNHLTVSLFNVGLSQSAGRAAFTYYPRMSNASTMFPDESSRAALMGRDYILQRFRTLPRPWAALLSLCPSWIRVALAERVRKYYLKKHKVTCGLTTLSGVLRKHGICRVDLLKVDAEQSEQSILAGLDDEDWPKIRQVVIEVHGGDEAIRDMRRSLHRRGFQTAVESNPTFPSLSLLYGVRPDDSPRN